MQISDLLCRYHRTSISSHVFHQIVGFSDETVAYLESHAFRGNATSELSAMTTTTESRKLAKKKKTLNVQRTFVSLPSLRNECCQS